MTQNNKTPRFSFYQLLTSGKDNTQYKIVIPIIQRDYAQGRETESTNDVRYEFLLSLYNYLRDGKTHDLDFVYGSSEQASDRKSFIPLDGQQRLTTLFLLHWYLMQRSADVSDKKKMKEALTLATNASGKAESSFLYMTRQTSVDFCNALINDSIDFSKLEKIKILDEKGKEKETESIAATLANEPWFVPAWNFDPTVQSMLVMLDAIHGQFSGEDCTKMLKSLIDNEHPAITFIFMDLDEYNLTDDLYIKMNSRGKPLTPFENFKAKFEQYIGAEEKNNKVGNILHDFLAVLQNKNGNGIYTKTVRDYFSYNIDTKWTNLFWAYCKDGMLNADENKMEKYLEKALDGKMANFIRVIFTNQYVSKNTADNATQEKDTLDKYLLNDKMEYLSFTRYDRLGVLSPECVVYLISALDILANGTNTIKVLLEKGNRYFDEDKVFRLALNNKPSEFTYPDRVRFHAYLQYIMRFGTKDISLLEEWMRVIYNLSDNDNTRYVNTLSFARNVESVNEILDRMKSDNQPSVLAFLSTLQGSNDISAFTDWQKKEEIIKAHLLRRSNDWRKIIIEAENEDYFNGQIGFLLNFSGIEAFFDNSHNCSWNASDDKTYMGDFKRYYTIAKNVFKGGYDNRELADGFIFERAMLSVYPEYVDRTSEDNRKNLLTSTRGGNIKRDNSWRRFLHDSGCEIPGMVKALFDKIDVNKGIKKELEDIISSCKPKYNNWVKVLIDNPETIKQSPNGFIYFYDKRQAYGNVVLFGNKYQSKDDTELYTYSLWSRQKIAGEKSNISFTYKNVNPDSECPHIEGSFSYKDRRYTIKLYAKSKDRNFAQYFFVVANETHYVLPKEIVDALCPIGFTLNNSDSELVMDSKATDYLANTVINELDKACDALSKL